MGPVGVRELVARVADARKVDQDLAAACELVEKYMSGWRPDQFGQSTGVVTPSEPDHDNPSSEPHQQ